MKRRGNEGFFSITPTVWWGWQNGIEQWTVSPFFVGVPSPWVALYVGQGSEEMYELWLTVGPYGRVN